MQDSLERFVTAQAAVYETALREIGDGYKETHWMWFIFPQLRGLGRSETAIRYGIRDLNEARAYLDHPLLGPRLIAATRAVIDSRASPAEIFGGIDTLKFSSCMTLFAAAAGGDSVFSKALGSIAQKDEATLRLMEHGGRLS